VPVPITDILMITYNRPRYTGLSLERLLATCDETMRVWVWHNGDDAETLKAVQSLRDHPRFFQFHHCSVNKKLREPTNWFWQHSTGDLVGKVDDDCLMPDGWGQTLRKAHTDVAEFGVLGCWPFLEGDYVPELAEWKTREYAEGHRLMMNCWVGGSGYLMKRQCLEQVGPIVDGQSFTGYCVQLAVRGWVNGWYLPLLCQDHMDDPRSEHTNLRTDEDFQRLRPLTAKTFEIDTLAGWVEFIREDARSLLQASADPKHYVGWRVTLRKLRQRLKEKARCGAGAR
jgi:cellulose synthase/poly-beta-1,6-N-acetylglucosamine synthase-like glycosyltransferase